MISRHPKGQVHLWVNCDMMVLALSKEPNREGFIIFLAPNGGSSVRILNTAVRLLLQNIDNIQTNIHFMHQNLSKL